MGNCYTDLKAKQKVPHKSVYVAIKVPHKSVLIFQKVPHKNVIYFTISLIFSIFAAKKQYMERFIMQDLIAWKNREDRKPLILLGARQVGKTYILKEFGQREFENVAYINCDNNAMAKDLFASDYNIDRILLTIGAITGVNIEAGKTLIIMDEIQELYRGLASLKYFCENAREYHVAVLILLIKCAGNTVSIDISTKQYRNKFSVFKFHCLKKLLSIPLYFYISSHYTPGIL